MIITSRQNENIKAMKRFYRKKYRDQERRFLAEGVKVVREAFEAGWKVETFLYSVELLQQSQGKSLLNKARNAQADLWEVADPVLYDLADTKSPQGVIALIVKPERSLEDFLDKNHGTPLIVGLDGIQDPGNLGTIMRTADACGLMGLIALKGSVDLYNPKVVRAAAGSLFYLPAIGDVDAATAIPFFKRANFQLLVADPQGEVSIYDCDFNHPTLLFMGNESRGCTDQLRQAAEKVVHIPMPGHADSLNVGVAASLFIYEAVRQKLKTSLSLP